MINCDILYFIEHPVRELEIATAVKYICEKDFGLSVVIKSLPLDVWDATHRYRPKVAVFPFFYSSDIKFYYQGGYYVNHWKNVTYFNLNSEQYLSSANKEFKTPRDDFVKSIVHHHAWSDTFRDYLVEYGVDPGKIFVNGNANFMLYREPYRKLFPDKNEMARRFRLDPYKRWALLAENYGWAFLTESEIKTKIDQGFEEKEAYLNREINRQNVSTVIRWLRDICKERNDVEIILRPRPSVSTGEWKDIIEKEIGFLPKGLNIIKAGTIKEWALSSDIILSSVSTCLMDAVVADKPAYVLEPIDFPRRFVHDWFDDIDHLKTYGEFISAIDTRSFNDKHRAFRDNIFAENFANGDPIRNLTEYLSSLVKAHQWESEYVYSPFDSIHRLYRRVASIKGAAFRIIKGEYGHQRHELDRIKDRDISSLMSRWKEILD